jgi:hypothetical protein
VVWFLSRCTTLVALKLSLLLGVLASMADYRVFLPLDYALHLPALQGQGFARRTSPGSRNYNGNLTIYNLVFVKDIVELIVNRPAAST